jgi:very-short-patch-repair endonuclease
MHLNNLPYLLEKRRKLRNNLTPAEALLWTKLQRSKLKGRKFRRQHSFGNFILDFYCPSEKLAIELDGAGHFTQKGIQYDQDRTNFLNEYRIKVIRFENQQVLQNMQQVLKEIKSHFKTRTKCKVPPSPILRRRNKKNIFTSCFLEG